jgi:hypothetical protein
MATPAQRAGRPRFDIADIVRQHRHELEELQPLSLDQRRALDAMAVCRTAALGGHLDLCPGCGLEHPAYNSCRNRHCPKCQALAQEEWISARAQRLLPIPHFHVVFTLPSELRPLARKHPRLVYDALLRAAGDTLLDLGRSRFQATLGVTLVLHTWTRELTFHPHAHALVTAGGLGLDGAAFVHAKPRYLFPVKVMGELLRGKMMDAVRRLHLCGKLGISPADFNHLMARLARTSWVVYAKKPFRHVRHVLCYLGRYTHRVAISNSRLVDVTDDHVTFRTKNGNAVTLAPARFLGRFVQHVLPDGLKKIRHYGLYASSSVLGALAVAHALIQPPTSPSTSPTPSPSSSWVEQLLQLTGRDAARCPRCGHALQRRILPATPSRSPPRRAAA